ncbi:MAG: (d)CMP kinase [Polyangia bacterium]
MPQASRVVATVVAIDGPAGAGKSTVARALAERLGFSLLDTGAIYRTLAWSATRDGLSLTDGAALGHLAEQLPIAFDGTRVLHAGTDVSTDIRTPAVSLTASSVSAFPEVRAALLGIQRRLAQLGRVVVEGRDIGTVVLPHAPMKFFLTARPEIRARRRYDELIARGAKVELGATLTEMIERDRRDEEREVAPLRRADDAELVDTSDLPLEEVIAQMEQRARQRLGL